MSATATLPEFRCRSKLCVLRAVGLMALWAALVAGFVLQTWPAVRTAPDTRPGTSIECAAGCPTQAGSSGAT